MKHGNEGEMDNHKQDNCGLFIVAILILFSVVLIFIAVPTIYQYQVKYENTFCHISEENKSEPYLDTSQLLLGVPYVKTNYFHDKVCNDGSIELKYQR